MTMDEWYREKAEALYQSDEIDCRWQNGNVSYSGLGAWVSAAVWVPAPVCAECREIISSMRGVRQSEKDGALFHGRCWDNTKNRRPK